MSDRLDFPLHGLAVYNPRLLSKDELVRFFVARQRELGRLVDALRREAEGQPQHHLVVGARGMGKTTLLNRLRYAIEDDPQLRERCLGLVFPEEQYNIGSLSDFWLNCIDALADVLEHRGHDELSQELDEQIAHLQSLSEANDRGRRGQELLCTLADRLGRRLVLLVDNVDLVIDRLSEKEEWALREVLSAESRIQLVGGTSAPFESYYRHDKAFYDFFRIHQLQGLSDDETFTVLRRLAETTGHDHIAHLLDDDPARIRTLRLMAGGNPRTVVILFNLLAKDVDGNVRSDLEQLLDYCTPLYKHRLDVLPPQAQRVVDALAMHWDPANAATIATTTHLPVNVVSTQLNRLAKEGTVEKVALPGSKRLGFQLAERFFNIWCLMRASRRVRRRLVWLVEFLRTMFEPEDLVRRAQGFLGTGQALDLVRHAEWGFALADAIADQPLQRALESRSIFTLCSDPDLRNKLTSMLDLQGEDAPLRDRAERMRQLAEAKDALIQSNHWEGKAQREYLWNELGGLFGVSAAKKLVIAKELTQGSEAASKLVSGLIDAESERWDGLLDPSEQDAIKSAIRDGNIDLLNPSIEDLQAASSFYNNASIAPCTLAIILEQGRNCSDNEFELLSNTLDASRSILTYAHWIRNASKRTMDAAAIANRLNHARWSQPQGYRAMVLLFVIRFHQHRWRVAEILARKIIQSHIDTPTMHILLIKCLINQHRIKDALSEFHDYAPRFNPNEHTGAYSLASQCTYYLTADTEKTEQLALIALNNKTPDCWSLSVLSLILVARGKWNKAVTYVTQLVGDYGHRQDAGWLERDAFFAEVVKHRFIPQARALLAELALNERWEPLDRALELVEADEPAQLTAIAPEMREAVRLVLTRIAPDFLSPPH